MDKHSISLHFGLKEGEKADLEVVAAAATQWVEALRAGARRIDPNAKLRVELIDASEGSLRLNTVFDWIEEQLKAVDEGASDHPRLKKLAITLAFFFGFRGGPNI